MKTKVLGKKSKKLNFTGKDLLDSIPRNRKKIEHGIDIWNVYDFMFKDKKEVPHLKVLEIIIPSNSKFIVESKSMKLYLNSFYDIAFTNQSEILKKIKRDLKSLIKDDVKLRFIDKFSVEPKNIDLNQSNCETIQRRKIIKFNGFRSICPVTSQPDFANIYIYSSDSLSRDWLLSYLTSFKDHGDFHEQCIESVFNTILRNFNPKHLEVAGRFQRRGGIDINPVRGTHKKFLFKNFREFNQ
ncbi:MAG: 7-cyano-7-deazaguanine reductase [Pseudomonadota bacterium]|nr:7-cyano-7-deazaguanine reductase [Pseudomonadota bacterium]